MIIPFGVMAVSAGLVTLLLLPETMGKPLPETIQQIENPAAEVEMQPLNKRDEKTAGDE